MTLTFKQMTTLLALAGMGMTAWSVKAEEKPKFTIKEVMDKGHKPSGEGRKVLYKQFVKGEASEDERKLLLELYEALAANSPPTGSAESWKEKTEALVAAVKSDDGKALEKAVNCGSCHKAHKQ